jgi:hypothetical protein
MREAPPEEATESLAYALLYRPGKRTHDAEAMLAKIVADRLVEHLRLCGFVLMKKPPAPHHTTTHHYPEGEKPP